MCTMVQNVRLTLGQLFTIGVRSYAYYPILVNKETPQILFEVCRFLHSYGHVYSNSIITS